MRLAIVLTCLVATATSHALAQQESTASAYTRGAGAYFADRPEQAEKFLTEAIDESPDDPRGYYLRGLNRLAMQNLEGARADLSKGAKLEAQWGSSSPLVDRSLSAVQGPARLTLERIRRAARDEAEVAQRQVQQQTRRQQRAQREQRVLRTDYQLPLEALASRLSVDQARQVAIRYQPSGTTSSGQQAPTAAAGDNPFADDASGSPMAGPMDQGPKEFEGGLDGEEAPGDDPITQDDSASGDPFMQDDSEAGDPFFQGSAEAEAPLSEGDTDSQDDPDLQENPFDFAE